MTIAFTVYGVPQTKGSAKAFYKPGMRYPVITNDNHRNKNWSQTVSAMAQQHRPKDAHWDGPIALTLCFLMPIPKSLPKSRPVFMTKRPDLDKCLRSVKDALKGVLYCDDSQVVVVFCWKKYGHQPGVVVEVERMDVVKDHRYAFQVKRVK